MSNPQTVELPSTEFARHVLAVAVEDFYAADAGIENVDSDVEYDLYDGDVTVDSVTPVSVDGVRDSLVNGDAVADEATGIRVAASTQGHVTERTSRGSRHHPPEYESHDIEIAVNAYWFPTTAIAPATRLEVEQVSSNPLAPPDPEPKWRDI